MSSIIFDIETGPLPRDILLSRIDPFDESSIKNPGEFDPAAVKCGNYGAEKAAEKIEAKRREHEKEVAKFQQRLADAKAAHEAEQIAKAALSPTTGQVLAIGFWDEARSPSHAVLHGDEETILAKFWAAVRMFRQNKKRLVGFNCCGFDLPFVLRRSWILGLPVPNDLLERGRWWSEELVVDLASMWKAGTGDYIKLDSLCRALGVGEKNGNGADFAGLFERDQAAAIEYLRKDLELTARVAQRLGVV